MKKKSLFLVLFILIFLFSCSSTQYSRIHKDIGPVEKDDVSSPIVEVSLSEEKDSNMEEDYSTLTPLYESGILYSRDEEKSITEIPTFAENKTYSNEEEIKKEEKEIISTELSEEKAESSFPFSIEYLYIALVSLFLIVVIAIVCSLRKKTKKTKHVEKNENEVEDYNLYIDKLINEEKEKGNL